MLKIIITGTGGQLGTEIQNSLTKSGYEIHGFTRKELNITDRTALHRCFKDIRPDIIINTAAYTSVDDAEANAEEAFLVNRNGPKELAHAANSFNSTLIHFSTDYVFNGKGDTPFVEEDLHDSINVYGKSKSGGDEEVINIAKNYYIFRVSWVFGAYGPNFVKTMLRLASQHNSLQIVGDQYGAPTYTGHISNVVLGFIDRINTAESAPYGVYHFSGKPITSWYEFADEIFDQALSLGLIDNKPELRCITTEEYKTPASRPMNSRLDCTRIIKTLGKDQPEWKEGLREMLETMQEKN